MAENPVQLILFGHQQTHHYFRIINPEKTRQDNTRKAQRNEKRQNILLHQTSLVFRVFIKTIYQRISSICRKNYRQQHRKVAYTLYIRDYITLYVTYHIGFHMRWEKARHRYLENVMVQLIIVRKIRQHRKEKQNKWKQTQEKAPRYAGSLFYYLISENTAHINPQKSPERDIQYGQIDII